MSGQPLRRRGFEFPPDTSPPERLLALRSPAKTSHNQNSATEALTEPGGGDEWVLTRAITGQDCRYPPDGDGAVQREQVERRLECLQVAHSSLTQSHRTCPGSRISNPPETPHQKCAPLPGTRKGMVVAARPRADR